MFDDLVQDGKNAIRAITATLGSILSVMTALSLFEGFVANSQNVYTILGFLLCWAIFSLLTDELDSALKKTLVSFGIPAMIVGLAIVVMRFAY